MFPASKRVKVEVVVTETASQQFAIQIAESRPPTNIGSRQGDHVSAYALLVHLILRCCENLNPKDAIKMMLYIFEHYASIQYAHPHQQEAKVKNSDDNIQELYEIVKGNLEQCLTPDQQNFIITLQEVEAFRSKVELALKLGKYSILERVMQQLIKYYITKRNKLFYTAFPREGNREPPTSEGSRIKKALRILAEYKDTDAAELIVGAIVDLIWYPKIEVPISSGEWSSDEYKTVRDKYTKFTKPRDNDLDTLCMMLERHLLLIIAYCGALEHNPSKFQNILNSVILKFLTDQHWLDSKPELPELDTETISQTVQTNIKSFLEYGSMDQPVGQSGDETNSSDSDSGDMGSTEYIQFTTQNDGQFSEEKSTPSQRYAPSDMSAMQENIPFQIKTRTQKKVLHYNCLHRKTYEEIKKQTEENTNDNDTKLNAAFTL